MIGLLLGTVGVSMPPGSAARPGPSDAVSGSRLLALWRRVTGNLLAVPVAIVVAAAALAVFVVEGDGTLFSFGEDSWAFGGDAAAASSLLTAITTSVIPVAGLVLSITVVALQLTSSQFSPRVLRTLFADRVTQVAVGAFVGVFVYGLLVLRSIRGGDGGAEFVPRFGVTLGILLGVVALVLLLVFIHHITQLIQVSNLAARIGLQTLQAVGRLYPEGYGRPPAGEAGRELAAWRAESRPESVNAGRPGYVTSIDLDALSSNGGAPARIYVLVRPGDFVSVESPLAEVWAGDRDHERVRKAFSVESERTIDNDAAFGFRQLTDVALRAISPSTNDPTTAVTCIGYVQAALVSLAGRRFPDAARRLEDGTAIIAEHRAFEEYLSSLAEIARYAQGDPRVAGAVLGALGTVAQRAAACGASSRSSQAEQAAREVASRASREAGTQGDRAEIERSLLAALSQPGS